MRNNQLDFESLSDLHQQSHFHASGPRVSDGVSDTTRPVRLKGSALTRLGDFRRRHRATGDSSFLRHGTLLGLHHTPCQGLGTWLTLALPQPGRATEESTPTGGVLFRPGCGRNTQLGPVCMWRFPRLYLTGAFRHWHLIGSAEWLSAALNCSPTAVSEGATSQYSFVCKQQILTC